MEAPFTQPSVLIVDDQAEQCELLRLYLSSHGFDVIVAQDGEEALELLQSERVDVVVTDVQMPRCDGLELVRTMKTALPAPPPVIAMSAYHWSEQPMLQAGARAFVRKPVGDLKALLALVRELVHGLPKN